MLLLMRGILVFAQSFLRSEEHTSELQSLRHLVCRLLLEKKKRAPADCPNLNGAKFLSVVRMPLARYFLFVGGVLLALLFISDSYLLKAADAKRIDADLPAITIRINSNHKLPARVVYDTRLPTILPAAQTQVAVADTGATVPPKIIVFFFNDAAPTEIYTLSLHDALPISDHDPGRWPAARSDAEVSAAPAAGSAFELGAGGACRNAAGASEHAGGSQAIASDRRGRIRSEEHTSELQSLRHLVCRLLLEKKK